MTLPAAAPVAGSAPNGATPEGPAGSSAKRSAVATVLASWLVARVLTALSYGLAWGYRRVVDGDESRLDQGLLAWDGDWYRKIADLGYSGTEAEALRFFPLYPLLGRWVGGVFGGDVRLGLIVVANIAALASGLALWRLVMHETNDVGLATRAVWLLALFPAGFVLVFAYSEALFLLATLVCVLGLRTQRWALASLGGLLASLSRPLGVLLMIPAAIEVGRWWVTARVSSPESRSPSPKGILPEPNSPAPTTRWKATIGQILAMAGAVVTPALGLVGYGAWVGFSDTGAWDDPFRQQEQFRGAFVDPFTRLARGFSDLFNGEALGDGLHLPFGLAFIALTVVVGRRWPMSYTAFTVAGLVLALSADNLNSLERYALGSFPLVLALASITRNPNRYLVGLGVSAAGFVAMATLAWTGAYVP